MYGLQKDVQMSPSDGEDLNAHHDSTFPTPRGDSGSSPIILDGGTLSAQENPPPN